MFHADLTSTELQVVDVCVADEHRRTGLGSQMLKELCRDTRENGAQSIAVFTGPTNRLFFWRNGFRLDFRYRVCALPVFQSMATPMLQWARHHLATDM